MVSIRFKSFILGFMLILLALSESFAHTQQEAMEKKPMSITTKKMNMKVVSINEDFFDGVPTPLTIEAKNKRLGGRKMLVGDHNVLSNKKEIMKQEELPINGKEASKNSSAKHFVGKCYRLRNHERNDEKLGIECNKLMSDRSLSPAKKVNVGGFLAFNADYHVPHPHPPKNNR